MVRMSWFAAVCAVLVIGMSGARAENVELHGAGATFPAPLYSKWVAEFNKANATIKVDYQAIGSGGGIKGITDRTVQFAGSDAPMTDEQLAAGKGAILHIPTVAGAVVVTYNLDGNPALKLSGDVVADIYPIATFTYFLVYKNQSDKDKGTAVVKYFWWAENEGQGYAKELGYAPIPEQIQPKIKAALQSINYQGQSLLGQ